MIDREAFFNGVRGPLFGGKRQVSMFEVPKLLARHAH